MKHSRGIKRRTWTSETAVDYINRVLHGMATYGLKAVSALDYLRSVWPSAESYCRMEIMQHLDQKEAARANDRIA